MSLLNFFPTQRRRWQRPDAPVSAEFLAGGLAALALAEEAFRATPLLNAQQQNQQLQHELEDVSYELTRARNKIKHLEGKLLASEQALAKAPQLHQRKAYRARRKLREVAAVADHPQMKTERKLRKIQELAHTFLAAVGLEEDAAPLPETPAPPVPLPA